MEVTLGSLIQKSERSQELSWAINIMGFDLEHMKRVFRIGCAEMP